MSSNTMNKHRSAILDAARITRVAFDPTDTSHRTSLKAFLETGKWGNVRFKTELPYLDAYTTAMAKLAKHHLGIE